jgi:Holliday junction DNA helicase RuvA
VILETGGVGYDVTVPVSTFSNMPDIGAAATLRVYTHVREDALQLFGFASVEEKLMFEKLISVSGVGPKLAITILSGLVVPELVQAIRSSQTDRLTRVPGIGKKTAERLVVELRDKLDALAPSAAAGAAMAPKPAERLSDVEQDVLSALVNLGANRQQAEAAVAKVRKAGEANDFPTLFRRAMEQLR